MDVDWCLSCGRHLNGSATYCSRECLSHDDPAALTLVPPADDSPSLSDDDDQIVYHEPKVISHVQWVGSGAEGIRVWAAGIPSGAAGAPSPDDISFTRTPPPVPRRPTLPPSPLPASRPAKLLPPQKRPIPPTLCITTPTTACPPPSFPVFTPRRQMGSLSLGRSLDVVSPSGTSLLSGVTEPFVATPSSVTAAEPLPVPNKSSLFNAFATLRSWVPPSIIPPSPKHSYKRPTTTSKMTDRCTRADKPPTFAFFAKTHRLPSLPSKKPAADSGAVSSWWLRSAVRSPSHIEKESFDFDFDIRIRAKPHPSYAIRGRKASRVIA